MSLTHISPNMADRHTASGRKRDRSPRRSPSPEAGNARKRDGHKAKRSCSPYLPIEEADLPVVLHREAVLRALEKHSVVICVGETGSGKTTKLPQFLVEWIAKHDKADGAGLCVAVTQPRRVATVSVAQRVAEEMHTRVGGKVGYAIRFESHTSKDTTLKFLTDGVLVRECLQDPMLTKYKLVMLDEAHERSIHTDILLGLLKQLTVKRNDFKLLVTSATLDVQRFADFFHSGKTTTKKKKSNAKQSISGEIDCPIVTIPGRSFPVDIFHSKQRQIMGRKGPISTYVRAAVETTLQVHNSEPAGHILVFLTGQQEIEDACAQIRALHREQQHQQQSSHLNDMELRVLPLYGALHGKMQHRIFDPVPSYVRKVIVATNIAETSLTIDGVRYVIDSGFTKQKVYNPLQQMESLVVIPISKVSAQQRAGRAGRIGPGKCYRLYSKESYDLMMDETIPEIQRANLANSVLYLKLLGIHDVLGFPYLDPPDEESILDSLKQLYMVGALDASGLATPLGKLMSAFPLEPKLSRALIEGIILRCGQEMAKIVSMLSVENIFAHNPQSRHRQDTGRQRHSEDHSEDDNAKDGEQASWEKLMLRLKDERLLDPAGDHLSYLTIFESFARARNRERWCEDHQIRLRAMKMAKSINGQLLDIMDAVSRKDLEAVKGQRNDPKLSDMNDDFSIEDRICKAGKVLSCTFCVWLGLDTDGDLLFLR